MTLATILRKIITPTAMMKIFTRRPLRLFSVFTAGNGSLDLGRNRRFLKKSSTPERALTARHMATEATTKLQNSPLRRLMGGKVNQKIRKIIMAEIPARSAIFRGLFLFSISFTRFHNIVKIYLSLSLYPIFFSIAMRGQNFKVLGAFFCETEPCRGRSRTAFLKI